MIESQHNDVLEYEYNVVLPIYELKDQIIKRSILLTVFSCTMNTWNDMTQRYSDSKILRKGMCITFEGKESDFDNLLDQLYADESNMKVIGIYENN